MSNHFLIISDRQPEGAELAVFTDAAKDLIGYQLGMRGDHDAAVAYALGQLEKGLGTIRVVKFNTNAADVVEVVFTAEAAW